MAEHLDWGTDGADWPLRDASRFVAASGIRWHVQMLGDGPPMLLLHGTGASTHSWRDIAPRLAERWRVVMPDLPGHGFTGRGSTRATTLPGMAEALGALLAALDVRPVGAVGHSAGAAIAVRMALDGHLPDARALVSLNGAFVPFEGVMRVLSPVARLLAATPLAARVTARRAEDGRAVDRLLASTGSRLDPAGRALYARLVRSPGHVAGALAMMAGWDLERLWRDLPRLAVPLRLAVGDRDGTVPPESSERAAARVPGAGIERLAGLGHLMHEEAPERLAMLVETLLQPGLSTQPDTVRSGHVDTREAATESDRARGAPPDAAGIDGGVLPGGA